LQTIQQLLKIVNVGKRPASVDVDCFEGFFGGLLRGEAQVFIKGPRGQRSLGEREVALSAG